MRYKFLVAFLLMSVVTSVYAAWDQKCLNDCFSTGHECKYCSWQCSTDKQPKYRYYSDTPCPLENDYSDKNYRYNN